MRDGDGGDERWRGERGGDKLIIRGIRGIRGNLG